MIYFQKATKKLFFCTLFYFDIAQIIQKLLELKQLFEWFWALWCYKIWGKFREYFVVFCCWCCSIRLKVTHALTDVYCLLATWLLFFPNAPYILTDLFHLQRNLDMPIWFDLILILSFAWTGLLFGFLSLWDLEKILSTRFKLVYVRSISILMLFAGSFGIYLGRYLRWNSWDILTEPLNIIYDISDRFINPWQHPRTWGMTIAMFFFLSMMYWSFRVIVKRENSCVNTLV